MKRKRIQNWESCKMALQDIFTQNEYFEQYLKLVETNLDSKKEIFKTCAHHVIPICFYVVKYKCTSRKEAEESYAEEDPNNGIVYLSHRDHLLAHWYLVHCCPTENPSDKLLHYKLLTALRISCKQSCGTDKAIDPTSEEWIKSVLDDWEALQEE